MVSVINIVFTFLCLQVWVHSLPIDLSDDITDVTVENVNKVIRLLTNQENLINPYELKRNYSEYNSKRLLTSGRCGIVDTKNLTRHKRYIQALSRWTKRSLTYRIANYLEVLGLDNIANNLQKAFNMWSRYSGLRFTRSYDENVDIIISFERGDHGDGNSFDGPGNVLAHASFPNNYGNYIHFDADENWNNDYFFTVALHEIGHSLGLDHSDNPNSIMFSNVLRYFNYLDSRDEAARLVSRLYGYY